MKSRTRFVLRVSPWVRSQSTPFRCGWTHLAIAIARACIRGGARGRFFNVVDLVNRLEAETCAGRQGRLADYLSRMDFIVLDELRYEFIHRTFLEYFYARHLNDEHFDLEPIVAVVRDNVLQGRNLVASHLAIQLWAGSYSQRSAMFLERLLSHVDGARLARARGEETSSLFDFCRFMAEAAKYLHLTEDDVARITRELVVEATDVRRWSGILFDVLEAARHNQEGIILGIRLGIGQLIDEGKLAWVGVIADWLYAQRLARHANFTLSGIVRIPILSELSVDVEQALSGLFSSGERSASFAKLIFDLGGRLEEARARESSIRVWTFGSGIDERLDWRFVDFTLMLQQVLAAARQTEGAPYGALARAVVSNLHRTAPQRLATRDVTTTVDWALAPPRGIADALLDDGRKAPLAFSLMGLHEVCTSTRTPHAPPYLDDIPGWVDRMEFAGEEMFGGFARAWCRREAMIFNAPRSPRTCDLGTILERALFTRSAF